MSFETISETPETILNPRGETVGLRFDVNSLLIEKLGESWQGDIQELVAQQGKTTASTAEDPTCREDHPTDRFILVKLNGQDFIDRFPEFWELYQGSFKELMRRALPASATPLTTYPADHARDCLDVLSQIPPPPDAMLRGPKNFRLDAHVDQRYSAILCVAAPKSQSSGRLVVAGNADAVGLDEINKDATYVNHKSGTLLCFPQGTVLPHYTEPIQEGDQRIVLSINYPLETETAEDRERMAQHYKGLF